MIDISKDDYQRFYVVDPSPDFSPAHNKAVIEGTIKKYEAKVKQVSHEFNEGLYERSDLIYSYIRHLSDHSDKPIEKYAGQKYLSELRNEARLEKMKQLALQNLQWKRAQQKGG